jgi:hypothetical protein
MRRLTGGSDEKYIIRCVTSREGRYLPAAAVDKATRTLASASIDGNGFDSYAKLANNPRGWI